MEPATSLPDSNNIGFAKPAPPDERVQNPDEDESDEAPAEDRFDKQEDRIAEQYVGSKIKALNENGWFIGTVKYFNTLLQEYYVMFTDDTED